METKAGISTRTYLLCWKDGKIVSIADKGMYDGRIYFPRYLQKEKCAGGIDQPSGFLLKTLIDEFDEIECIFMDFVALANDNFPLSYFIKDKVNTGPCLFLACFRGYSVIGDVRSNEKTGKHHKKGFYFRGKIKSSDFICNPVLGFFNIQNLRDGKYSFRFILFICSAAEESLVIVDCAALPFVLNSKYHKVCLPAPVEGLELFGRQHVRFGGGDHDLLLDLFCPYYFFNIHVHKITSRKCDKQALSTFGLFQLLGRSASNSSENSQHFFCFLSSNEKAELSVNHLILRTLFLFPLRKRYRKNPLRIPSHW